MKLTPVISACKYSRLPPPVGMFRKRDVCVSEPKSGEETTVFTGYGCLFLLKLETIIMKLNAKRKSYLHVFCFLTSFSKRKI